MMTRMMMGSTRVHSRMTRTLDRRSSRLLMTLAFEQLELSWNLPPPSPASNLKSVFGSRCNEAQFEGRGQSGIEWSGGTDVIARERFE